MGYSTALPKPGVSASEVLTRTNTDSFTPSADYHPATKKYVDDEILGADGEDGASAYEVAVANGFVGDESAWLASLVGDDGADGADGAPGTDGADGSDGTDGLGWTGGSYNAGTGIVTFASADGLGFSTGDLRGADGADGSDGAPGADGADGQDADVMIATADAKTEPADADTFGLIDSADSSTLKKLSWSNIKATLKTYFDTLYRSKSAPYYIEVALSTNGESISSGTHKGFARVHTTGNITGLVIDCDPNNEPTITVEVDLNTINRSTGAATSVLSSVASITSGNNTGTGTVDGTQAVSAGDLLSFDIDQGSDGQDLIATVEITPA